jgi:hypothetical protein
MYVPMGFLGSLKVDNRQSMHGESCYREFVFFVHTFEKKMRMNSSLLYLQKN